MKIPAQKYLPVPKAGRLQAGGAGVRGGEARGERRGGFAPPEASGDPRLRAPPRAPAPPRLGARGAGGPAGLTPEQSERLGFGDERQGVHGPQVEQAHQEDVPPGDVLPPPARAGLLPAAAASLRALDPEAHTDFLLGGAEGDLPLVGGRAWHGWGEAGARGSGSKQASSRRGALWWGRRLLPFRRGFPHLPSPPSRGFSASFSLLLAFSAAEECKSWHPASLASESPLPLPGLNSVARNRRRASGAGGDAGAWAEGVWKKPRKRRGRERSEGGSWEERPA